jgi:tRNA(Ile)-lysidine synthase
MNEDMSFKRVRVRKILLPVLTDLNPKIVETLARTAGLLRSVNFSDDKETGGVDDLASEGVQAGDLLTANLKTLDKPELYRTLRSWLRKHRGDLRSISFKHLESIERLIFSQKSGRLVELPGGGNVTRGRGRLTYGNIKVDK